MTRHAPGVRHSSEPLKQTRVVKGLTASKINKIIIINSKVRHTWAKHQVIVGLVYAVAPDGDDDAVRPVPGVVTRLVRQPVLQFVGVADAALDPPLLPAGVGRSRHLHAQDPLQVRQNRVGRVPHLVVGRQALAEGGYAGVGTEEPVNR